MSSAASRVAIVQTGISRERVVAGAPPGSRSSAASRPGAVSAVLLEVLAAVPGRLPTVLDCGGGSGRYAVPLAQAGAHVSVVDISADALATLRRRAEEAGVGERIAGVQGDVESLAQLGLPDHPPSSPAGRGPLGYDLVLAHGILGAVDRVAPAFAAIAAAVRPGGRLSVLVANPVAGVLARALAGDLTAALNDLRSLDDAAAQPGPDAVRLLCRAEGLTVEQVHGVGVFSEFVRGEALDRPGAREALEELEAESATRAPFRDIASNVHLLARRPVG